MASKTVQTIKENKTASFLLAAALTGSPVASTLLVGDRIDALEKAVERLEKAHEIPPASHGDD